MQRFLSCTNLKVNSKLLLAAGALDVFRSLRCCTSYCSTTICRRLTVFDIQSMSRFTLHRQGNPKITLCVLIEASTNLSSPSNSPGIMVNNDDSYELQASAANVQLNVNTGLFKNVFF